MLKRRSTGFSRCRPFSHSHAKQRSGEGGSACITVTAFLRSAEGMTTGMHWRVKVIVPLICRHNALHVHDRIMGDGCAGASPSTGV